MVISKFIVLYTKSYAFKTDNVANMKAKGIRGHIFKNHITFEDYKRCMFDDTIQSA